MELARDIGNLVEQPLRRGIAQDTRQSWVGKQQSAIGRRAEDAIDGLLNDAAVVGLGGLEGLPCQDLGGDIMCLDEDPADDAMRVAERRVDKVEIERWSIAGLKAHFVPVVWLPGGVHLIEQSPEALLVDVRNNVADLAADERNAWEDQFLIDVVDLVPAVVGPPQDAECGA